MKRSQSKELHLPAVYINTILLRNLHFYFLTSKVLKVKPVGKLSTYFIGVAFRLVGGSSYNEGRVEVNYNGEWGTVCDDGWDDTDAGVVCRQLGFGSSGTAIRSAGFGRGSGSIWLDSVMCTGNESTLASCGHLGVGVFRSCSHFEDAGVRCPTADIESTATNSYKYAHHETCKEYACTI